MNNGTCIAFVLFYVFRHYKRIGVTSERNELVSDFKKCYLLLNRMRNNIDPNVSLDVVTSLIDRVNNFGADIKFEQPLRYADYYDSEIVAIMSRIIREVIQFSKSPFYRRHQGDIFTRLLVLHNLPRVLLDDTSGDESTLNNFHISKQDALEYVSRYLEN